MPFQGHQYGYMTSNGGGLARFILLIIFLLMVGAIALAIVRYVSHAHEPHSHHGPAAPPGPPPIPPTSSLDSALDVLRMRFARGEIDEDDYNRRVSVLQGNH